jgi:hypothetical protein
VIQMSQQSTYLYVCGEGYSCVGAMKQSVIKGNGGGERRCDEGVDEGWVGLVLVGLCLRRHVRGRGDQSCVVRAFREKLRRELF